MNATKPAEEETASAGDWFEFRAGQIHPVEEPEWVRGDDWQAVLRSQGYTQTQEDIGDIPESFLGLTVYHRGDHVAGHTWLFDFGASCQTFFVEVRGFPAYLEFLRWLAPALQLAALEKLHYRIEKAAEKRKD